MPAQEYNINVTADDGDVDAMRSLIDRFKPLVIAEAQDAATAAATSAAQAALYDGVWLDDVQTIIADTSLSYGPGASGVSEGDYVRTRKEGFSYQVAAEDATDHHLTTAGGVKLRVLPGADGLYNVGAWGADDTGATNCTDAFQGAINAAVAAGLRGIRIPAGQFLLTQAGAMDLPASPVNGFVYRGAGLGVTIINFINSATGTAYTANYLMNNNNHHLRVRVEGIRFQGDGTNKNSSMYYMTSTGTAQSIRFDDCMWYQFAQIMKIDGPTNASEILFNDCKISNTYETGYEVNNSQSLNHNFYGTDIESVRAGFFKFTAGGQLNVFGGSLITSDHPDGVVDNWLLELDDDTGSGIGINTWQFNFYGVRTEINGSSQLVRNNSGARVLFDGCNLVLGSTASRRVAYIGDKGRVTVRGGTVNGEWYLYARSSDSYAEPWRPAFLMLEDCDLRGDFSFVIEGLPQFGGSAISNVGGVGRVSYRNVRKSQGVNRADILDADFGWQYNVATLATPKKTAIIRKANRAGGLPQQTSKDRLILPLGAIVTSLRLVHPSQSGASGQTYYLQNDDGTTTHATWTFDAGTAQNAETTVYIDCSSDNERALVFTGDAANASTSYNGYLIVEYIG
ncbi:hypothetical protein [Sulfitobacter sp. M23508]|uniref:hypothetical protein n=1 Tax=Sulfitobacter sp. M23508 TaxID=3368577 RepID=UPI003745C824